MRQCYVGIDVSKKTLDVYAMIDDQKSLGVLKVDNTLSGFKKITEWITVFLKKHALDNAHVCLESTGSYSAKLESFLHEKTSFIISVCNPFKMHSFGKTCLIRTKTDKVDAKLIAHYAYHMKPAPSHAPDPSLKKLKQKLRFYQTLKEEIVRYQAQLDHFDDPDIQKIIHQTIASLTKKKDLLKAVIISLVNEHSELKQKHDFLISIPGIASLTAITLLVELINEGSDRLSRKAQTAHAGLAPRQKQSGTLNGKVVLSRFANPHLKQALYFPTLCSLRHNPIIKAFYLRLLAAGKPKMTAVVACMRKLLHIAIGVLNNSKPFDPHWINLPLAF